MLCVGMACAAFAQQTKHDLMFAPGQTKLSNTQKQELKTLALSMRNGERLTIYPLTHDSAYGRTVYAKAARAQAQAIGKYCESQGFEVMGTPSNFPSTYRGMSASITLKFHLPENEVQNPLKAHFPQKQSQFFTIDPTKDNVLAGEEGTVLYIKAGALLSNNEVEIELKEYYTLKDYITNGLQTASNGNMLQTGGTVYINAVDKTTNKPVGVNQDKGIGLDFTLGKNDPEMEVFVKDPKSSGPINWVRPKAPSSNGGFNSWEMTETIYDPEGNVVGEKTYKSKAEWDAYQEQLRLEREAIERAAAAERERLAAAAALREQQRAAEVKAMLESNSAADRMQGALQIYQLGWINCDRFPNLPMVPLVFAADDKCAAEYYLVFDDVRGVMRAQEENGNVKFPKVPKNKTATLIAIAFVGKIAYFFKKVITIGNEGAPTVTLEQVDEAFVNEQLALLK